MTSRTSQSLERAVQAFMFQTVHLLETTLSGSSPIDAEILADGERAFVEGTHPVTIAHSGSDRLVLRYEYLMRLDEQLGQLEIEKSTFKIEFRALKKPVPVVRFEYESQARNKPNSHFQFHADSVPLGLLLARAGKYDTAAQQQDIHFPMGSSQFRLHLADVIELLICEFGAASEKGWKESVVLHRKHFYESEVDNIIRSNLTRAADLLKESGYKVENPQ
ncbi:hypothetical protein [Corynebacterium riegelii]|uniref:hypothetical protein n=1 Tax=Corynebacterium riegelii TaxID=156976 RepID=UPI00068FCB54|nr:hypothetical protein [Corynebacterium riegelii]